MNRTGDILRVVSTGPAIFLLAILITVLFWNILPARFQINESSDYLKFYEPVARNIVQGSGITLRDSPATGYPPGHPIFLAAVFKFAELFMLPEEAVISTVILICTGLSSLFLFILARQVWGPVPAAVSALVWTTYPLALWLTKQPNSEVSFLVFFYGSFALLWSALSRKEQPMFFYFSSGFLIGIAMLIRPIALGIGVIMGVVVWFVKRERKHARAIDIGCNAFVGQRRGSTAVGALDLCQNGEDYPTEDSRIAEYGRWIDIRHSRQPARQRSAPRCRGVNARYRSST